MDNRNISLIGAFQLGNLVTNRVPFLFVGLMDASADVSLPLLSGMTRISMGDLESYVEQRALDKAYPIVLLCEDGTKSMKAAKALLAKSYFNIFVIEGGLEGLI